MTVTETRAQSIMFQAPPTNSGNIYISESSAQSLAGNRITLQPGDSLEIELDDSDADEDCVYALLSDFWFDGTVTNDDLVVTYAEQQSVDY